MTKTEEQLKVERATAIAGHNEWLGSQGADPDENLVFTCDNCGLRYTCEWVFDMYNTDGDCIASK
jgi:hypothetical protein